MTDSNRDKLAAKRLREASPSVLTPHSPAFGEGEGIPGSCAADQDNLSPPLQWATGPAGTQTYALIVEDPDAPKERPFVHWVLYNLPRDKTSLEEGASKASDKTSGDLEEGINDRQYPGYFGPLPPQGDAPHHYHFQVFALDTELDIENEVTGEELLHAMQGHVLAKGSCVGIYQRE